MEHPTEKQSLGITKEQLAQTMGISLSTLKRRLRQADLHIPRGVLSPQIQALIKERLGWHEPK
jgi:predicted DNA-binding protein (UPF0251 family)